ncbi:MAG: hypothetical protein PHE49_08230 [bacterium]|nr:hypothetical protein [bacterium]
MKKEWCKENYEKSITSRAWNSTPYDADWDKSKKYGEDIPSSLELKAIFEEELTLGKVPAWASEIINRMIKYFPPCGHYTFPHPLIQVCEAIKKETCPEFIYGCYTADSKRKTLMSYYVYCLDAWLKNAPLHIAKAELAMRDNLGKDWDSIITAVYTTLGKPSEQKTLLVTRLIHRLRWWIKTLIWSDDKRNRYMLDVYSGDIRGDETNWGAYGNTPFGDPYFAELELPEIKKLRAEICKKVPDGKNLLDNTEQIWLCAPKVFRHLEKVIIKIGNLNSKNIPKKKGILQCEDTYPKILSYNKWYSSFVSSLSGWLKGDSKSLNELGKITPVKHWLARILRHKLQLLEKHDNLGKLLGTKPSTKRGEK